MAFLTNLFLSINAWSRGRAYRKYLPTMLQLLDPKKDEILLDVGAGTGCIANRVAKYCDNVYALEPNNDKVEFIKAHYPEVKAFAGQVGSIPFPESYFDKIYVISALHHFPVVDAAIDEMARVLKPMGRILVHDSNPERMPLGARAERKIHERTNKVLAASSTSGTSRSSRSENGAIEGSFLKLFSSCRKRVTKPIVSISPWPQDTSFYFWYPT